MKQQAYSIREIAEAMGTFPTDIEMFIKEMYEKKMVSVWWYEGELYVALKNDMNLESLKTVAKDNEHLTYIS